MANVTFPLIKIVSGGQTGADLGALIAARDLRIPTGGFAPKGWLTEDGPQEALLRSFGLIECEEDGYPPRTRRNVIHSDGTLLVGEYQSGGSQLTYKIAKELKKPLFLFACATHATPDAIRIAEFRDWIRRYDVKTLNVAGNRESEMPGIGEFTRAVLLQALRQGPTGE
jgi:Circularly permutated YpsA SLOG family